MGHSRWRAGSYQVTWSAWCGPGAAGGSLGGQRGRGSQLTGQAAPGGWGSAAVAEVAVDLAGGVALEAADDLGLGQAFGGAPFYVGAGRGMGAHPGDDDPPQGVVGFAVAAAVEAVPGGLAGGGRDRGGRAQVRPGGLAAQPLR